MRTAASARRVPPSSAAIILAAAAAACTAAAGADGPQSLELAGGGVIAGRLVPTPPADGGLRDTLRWQAPGFTAPFELRLDALRGIRFPPPADAADPASWRVCLHGGDVLAATLEGLDEAAATVSRGAGDAVQRLRIDRAAIDRIVRAGAGTAGGYVGPAGLGGWEQKPPNSWTEQAGSIQTAVPGAAVTQDVGGPERAVYEFLLAWRRTASCRVAVAATADGTSDPYQLEVFGDDDGGAPQLLVVREEKETAASEPLPEDSVGPEAVAGRRLRLVLFVDQAKGRLAVVVPDRSPEPVADLTITPPPGRPASGRFRIVGGGDIVLERLRVAEWTGERPVVERREGTTVVRGAGGRLVGEVAAFAAGDRELVVRGAVGDERVPWEDVREIAFAEPDAPPPTEPAVRAASRGGEVLGGDLVRVDERAVWLQRAGIDPPVAVPIEGLLAIQSLRTAAAEPLPGRVGRLRREGVDARGGVAAVADGLGWQPEGGVTASPFAAGSAAVLEYVERSAAAVAGADHEVGGIGGHVTQDEEGSFVIVMLRSDGAAAVDGRIQAGDRIVAIAPDKGSRFLETKGLDTETVMNLLRGRIGGPMRLRVTDKDGGDPREVPLVRRTIHVSSAEILRAALETHARLAPGDLPVDSGEDFPAVAFLRTGDVLPCAVEAIDKDGIRIRTPLGETAAREAVAVPASLVQAVELMPAAASMRIDRKRIERLLTLPRMQRANPPTHLLRLTDGDYLRGRVLGLDGRTVRVALADAVKELPRETVVRVIWLHPEEPVEPPAAAAAGLLVQGVWPDGKRVTIAAERLDGGTIRGRSPVIGPAAIDTGAVDRLLIGAAIESEADERPYRQWKLKPAPEPRAVAAPAEG